METQQDHQPAVPRLGRYRIDTERSTLAFTTRHLFGLLPVRGTFAIRAGTVEIAEPLTGSRVRAEVEAASFRTGSRARDAAVRSARFLDAERHPLLVFTAERADAESITGTLTALGTSRPVRLAVHRCVASPGSFTVRATARVDRTEFGVTASRGMAGRHLEVALDITCVPE